MSPRIGAIAVGVATAMVVAGGTVVTRAARAQDAIVSTAPATSTPAAIAAPAPQPFDPGFDDLMTLLVQPRHLKLQYAASRRNWELAAAESRNLASAFGRIARALPSYLGIDVAEAMAAMMTPQLQRVDAAIAAADPARFAAAYGDLTKACNACHVYMERPYVVVKVPDPAATPTFPNQDFGPVP